MNSPSQAVEGEGSSPAPPRPGVRKRHRMVDRVAAILESIARSPEGMTLTDLSRSLDAPVSSIQGLVNGLTATGYLDERDRRYSLGTAPYLLNLLAGRHMVTRVNHAMLESISHESGLTTMLSIAVGRDVYYIDSCTVEARYMYLTTNHVRRSLIRTSSGWVLMADFSERELWSYLTSLPPEDEVLTDRYLRALDDIRRTGICAAPDLSDVADGVSIAVRERGRTVGTVSVVGPRDQIAARKDSIVAVLKRHRAQWEPKTAPADGEAQ